ncbi:MAG: type IX secretion system outer membrane channel protein PorV [Porphyromonadaceae bacterium]|nr:type IX secretion system outer membrane channel protein PorV [Porphyromonadaceae bacterium]
MKKTCLVILTTVVLTTFSLSAQNEIKDQLNPVFTGVPSLSITPDSRGGGMGDVGAATTPDINSQYWNPAKYAFMESPAGLSMSFTPWLRRLVNDINLSYLAGYWKFDELQSVSASLRYFSLGEIKLYDYQGTEGVTAHPNEMAIDIAYSRLLSEKLSAAVAFRYIRSDMNIPSSESDMIPGNAIAADVAAYYRTPIEVGTGDGTLAFGLNISNIGSKISYGDEESTLFIPTNLRLGGSFEYPFDDYNKISFNADINKLLVPSSQIRRINEDGTLEDENDFIARRDAARNMGPIAGIFKSFGDAPGGFSEELREIMWSLGAEYTYNNQFFVRAGYFNEHKTKGNRKYFSTGVGFKLNVFQLDAAYLISVAQSNPLDGTLRFTLGFDLDGLRNLMN